MKGRIIGLSCGVYSVQVGSDVINASARGIFRNSGIKPLVGDNVDINVNDHVIDSVYPRVSCLIRPPLANATQLIIIQSLVEPDFSYLLVFKYLTYANMNGLKPIIVLTKQDKEQDLDKINEITSLFKEMGIDVYVVDNKNKYGFDKIDAIFDSQISCLIGQTGVGKSSFINSICPSFSRKVGEYSKALHRGKHQTKEVVLLPYRNGYIADTPGFSSLNLDLFKEDLAKFFPSFNELSLECYYSNCIHLSEDRCAIKTAIEKGTISNIAYECYKVLSNQALSRKERYSK